MLGVVVDDLAAEAVKGAGHKWASALLRPLRAVGLRRRWWHRTRTARGELSRPPAWTAVGDHAVTMTCRGREDE